MDREERFLTRMGTAKPGAGLALSVFRHNAPVQHNGTRSPTTFPGEAMRRPLRIAFPGAVQHVTSRGHARAAIYADDADRPTFLALLTQVVQRYHGLYHAYCLMDHHYQLVLETPEGNLS